MDRFETSLPQRLPRREEISRATVEVIRAHKPRQADVRIVDLGEGPMVVKDFATRPWWVRWSWGRFLIDHEYRAYRWLGELPGTPVLLGRIDTHALAFEWVDGVQLTLAPDLESKGGAYFESLRQTVDRFRAVRFFHLDLRGRRNVLVRRDGQVIILDLQVAFWFPRRGLAFRLLGRWLSWYYDTVLLKWKELLAPQDLTPEDHRLLARSRVLRAMWVFNLKGSWRKNASG